jgi:hypothetical protein
MPSASENPEPPKTPMNEAQPQHEMYAKDSGAGAIVGIIIILLLLIAGAIYFWYARHDARTDSVPYIPGDSSTTSSS